MKGDLPRRTAAEGVRLEADGVSGSCQWRGDLFRERTFFLGMYVGMGIGFKHICYVCMIIYVHHPVCIICTSHMYEQILCMSVCT